MKESLKKGLDSVGLLGPVKSAKRAVYGAVREAKRELARQPAVHALQARGWLKWEPLVPEAEFSASCDLAIQTLQAKEHEFGDYVEFGVSRGTSTVCMFHALRRAALSDVRLIGFDSFEGMPSEAAEEGWAPGRYASTIDTTRRYLKSNNVNLDDVHLVKGWFADTLTPETVERLHMVKASLIMVDCDIYSASKEALWFCAPLIADQAIIIFDDWGWRSDKNEIGQREAYDEFLKAFPHFTSESLPAYRPQARIFHVTRLSGTDTPESKTASSQ